MMAEAMLPPPMKADLHVARLPLALAEDRGADANHRRALGQRRLEVARHAHRQRVEREALAGSDARTRLAQRARTARALVREVRVGARRCPSARAGAGRGSAATSRASSGACDGLHAALGRLAADVHLDAHLQRRQRPRAGGARARGDLRAIDGMDPVEVLGHVARLVALERADEMPVPRRSPASARDLLRALPGRSSRRNPGSPRAKASRIASRRGSWSPRPARTSRPRHARPRRCAAGRLAGCDGHCGHSCPILRWPREAARKVVKSPRLGSQVPHRLIARPRRNSTGNHGHLRAARLHRQEQGVGPAPVRGPAADDPRARRRAPHQRAAARAQGRARDGLRHHERRAAQVSTRRTSSATSRSRSRTSRASA